MYLAEQELSLRNALSVTQTGLAEIARGEGDFDLSGVTVADSSAVAVMLAWQRAANAKGKAIVFHGISASLSSLIALYGVSDFLQAGASERH